MRQTRITVVKRSPASTPLPDTPHPVGAATALVSIGPGLEGIDDTPRCGPSPSWATGR